MLIQLFGRSPLVDLVSYIPTYTQYCNQRILFAGPAVLVVEAPVDHEPGAEAERGGRGGDGGLAVQAGERGAHALEEAVVRPLRVLPLLLQR